MISDYSVESFERFDIANAVASKTISRIARYKQCAVAACAHNPPVDSK
jgi:hypothetical protein